MSDQNKMVPDELWDAMVHGSYALDKDRAREQASGKVAKAEETKRHSALLQEYADKLCPSRVAPKINEKPAFSDFEFENVASAKTRVDRAEAIAKLEKSIRLHNEWFAKERALQKEHQDRIFQILENYINGMAAHWQALAAELK